MARRPHIHLLVQVPSSLPALQSRDVFPGASTKEDAEDPWIPESEEIALVTIDDRSETESGEIPTAAEWNWQAWHNAVKEAASEEPNGPRSSLWMSGFSPK